MTLYCGVDFHSRRQSICYCDRADGEVKTKELHHYDADVRSFYEQFENEKVISGDTARSIKPETACSDFCSARRHIWQRVQTKN